MRTRLPTPENSQSEVAAILFAMSQTPPQKVADNPKISETPGNLERRLNATSPIFDSIVVSKVSNSDDEDAVTQARTVHRDTTICARHPWGGLPYIEHRAAQGPLNSAVARSTPQAVSTLKLAVTSRPNSAPLYASPYAMAEHIKPFPLIGGSPDSGCSGGVDKLAQVDGQAIPRAQLRSLIPGDIFEYCPGPTPSVAQNKFGVPSRHASVPLQYMGQISHESGFTSLSFEEAMSGSRYVSQPPPWGASMLPPTKTDERRPQYVRQPSFQVGAMYMSSHMANTNHPESVPNTQDVPGSSLPEGERQVSQPPLRAVSMPHPSNTDARATQHARQSLSQPVATHQPSHIDDVPNSGAVEGAGVRRKVQIPRVPYKHAVTPPRIAATKRVKTGFAPKEIDISDFKYRTIKAIKMPTRDGLMPGQYPPEPTPENLPYGDDIDYQLSMLMYWLDEKELTYSESARLYRLKFPGETGTDDTVRKKHYNTLIRLARRHGLRPEEDLGEPGKNVLRRGKQAGHKYNTIGGRVVYAAGGDPLVDGAARRKRVSEPLAHRGFLKACICVWKDTSDVSFEQIQRRLAEEYNWIMRANTVQKLYYSERARVYDMYGDAGNDIEEELDAEEATGAIVEENAVQVMAGEDAGFHLADINAAH